MSLQVEKLEKNMAKLTIEVSAQELGQRYSQLIRKIKAESVFPVSEKEKFPAR